MTQVMKHKYRNRTEIIATILSSIEDEHGLGITKLIYKSYLSYVQGQEYCKELQKLGMLRYDSDRKLYFITSKGQQYLKIYRTLKEQLGE